MPRTYEREPLVCIDENTNARPGSSTRKSLPTTRGRNAMDTGDSRKTEALNVTPTTDFYLDCDDYRSK